MHIAQVIASQIKALAKQNNTSVKKMLEDCDINKSFIYYLEKRQSIPTADKLAIIAQYFNVSTDYLLGVSDNPQFPKEREITLEEMREKGLEVYPIDENWAKIPVYGSITAGYNGLAFEEFEGYEILESSSVRGNIKDFFFLKARGKSMEPEILEGDLVLIKKQSVTDYSGQIAAVVYNNEESTLKKVYQNDKYIELRPINQIYESKIIIGNELNDVYICGVMKKLVRNY